MVFFSNGNGIAKGETKSYKICKIERTAAEKPSLKGGDTARKVHDTAAFGRVGRKWKGRDGSEDFRYGILEMSAI